MKIVKYFVLIAIVMGLMSFGLATIVNATTTAVAPATVTIDSGTGTKPAISFPHDKHAAAFVGKCQQCHATATGGAITVPKAEGMKNAWHTNCIDCHKAMNKGPKGCMQCHK